MQLYIVVGIRNKDKRLVALCSSTCKEIAFEGAVSIQEYNGRYEFSCFGLITVEAVNTVTPWSHNNIERLEYTYPLVKGKLKQTGSFDMEIK